MARRSIANPSISPSQDLSVVEHRLGNGLKVLLLPRKVAPIVVCDLYYPVGSFDEPAGQSGIAHFVEHMLFKGTERWPKGRLDRLAYVSAGQANAETSEDFTHYWFSFPSDRWEIALEIEADRMVSALFDPIEVEAERSVIAEERARDLESAFQRIDQQHLALSYLRHPYRNPILGWPEDLASIDAEALRGFHARHYRPDGAVLVIAGDIRVSNAIRAVERAFGAIAPGIDRVARPEIAEPRQAGRREFRLNEPESVARGLLGWHSVGSSHPLRAPLEILSDLLTTGRRSRLSDALVEKTRLATWVDSSQQSSRRAGQFLIQVEASQGSEPKRIEGEITRILQDLAENGPTPEEIERSRTRLAAAWRWDREDLSGLAAGLGEVALWEDWRAWNEHRRISLAVEAPDVQLVASTFLNDSNLTLGWSVPSHPSLNEAPGEAVSARRASRELSTIPVGLPEGFIVPGPSRRSVVFRPTREVLPQGLRLLSERRPGTGVVALEFYVDAGQLREAKPGLAYLTGRLLEEGTESRSADALATEIEDAGAALDVGSTGISLRIRAEDLVQGVEWLADLARRPSFPEASVDWLKKKIADEWRSDRDDPGFRSEMLFQSLIYANHPYSRDPRGSARDLAQLSRDDVVEHHRAHFTTDDAFLVVVGDFEPRRLKKIVERSFGDWRTESSRFEAPPDPKRATRRRTKRVSRPGEQVHIHLGHLGIRRTDPDFYPLQVVDLILGEAPGFTDRLSRVLRDELGLVYSVGGGITDSADREPGVFQVSMGTSPEAADQACQVAIEQIKAIHQGEFSDEEIEQAKAYLSGSWLFDFQTIEQRAGRILNGERWGLPVDDPLRAPERWEKLSPAEIRGAARRRIAPEALLRVEYGPILSKGSRSDAECSL